MNTTMASPHNKLALRLGLYADAADMIERFHYSGRAPSNVQIVGTLHDPGGLFGDFGEAVAACVLSIPPTRWGEPVLELSRLVRKDRQVPLSSLISGTCLAAKRAGHDLVVSFADRTQGHHGGVYQASSWAYHGCRDRRMDGVVISGVFYPGRSCNSRWGTRSPKKLQEIIGADVVPHFDEGKHLYWKALGSKGKAKAARLGLLSIPYPKERANECSAT